MALGKPGVPSWIDAAGDHHDQRSGAGGPAGSPDWAATGAVGGSSRAQAALSRALAYALWGGIALALVLSLVNCAGSPAAAPQPAGDPTTPAQPVPPPGGCAELVVAGWLAGDTELIAGVPGVDRDQPEPGRRQARRTYTAAATPGEAAWGYLVGAEVLVRDEQQRWQPAGTQFFTVTMVPAAAGGGCQGWRPAALPAQVAAPSLAGQDALPYDASLSTSGTPLSETLTAFFAGLLTGTGGLERYVAPGASIAPLAPPPYAQVEVTELRARTDPTERDTVMPADGTVLRLLATVRTGAEDLPLAYPLTVGVRGGRWEVIAIDPLVGSPARSPGGAGPVPTTSADSVNGG